jgi:hypothetical protein
MSSLEEKVKSVGGVGGGLVAEMKLLKEMQEHCGMFSNFIFFLVKIETLF